MENAIEILARNEAVIKSIKLFKMYTLSLRNDVSVIINWVAFSKFVTYVAWYKVEARFKKQNFS